MKYQCGSVLTITKIPHVLSEGDGARSRHAVGFCVSWHTALQGVMVMTDHTASNVTRT